MQIKRYKAGETLVQAGDKKNELYIVVDGSVKLRCPFLGMPLSKGYILGICREEHVFFPYDYIAETDVAVQAFDYAGYDYIDEPIRQNQSSQAVIACFNARKICDAAVAYKKLYNSISILINIYEEQYTVYCEQCAAFGIEPRNRDKLNDIIGMFAQLKLPEWVSDYYISLGRTKPEIWKALCNSSAMAKGEIIKTQADIYMILSTCSKLASIREKLYKLFLNPKKADIYGDFLKLAKMILKSEGDTSELEKIISGYIQAVEEHTEITSEQMDERFNEYYELFGNSTEAGEDEQDEEGNKAPEDVVETKGINAGLAESERIRIVSEIKNSCRKILEYVDPDVEVKMELMTNVKKYAECGDRASQNEEIRKIRRDLTRDYYTLYENAFFKYASEEKIPTIVLMFLYFGYIDETLANEENAIFLYRLAGSITPDSGGSMFTMFHWLKEIYTGGRETSVNEYNVDYAAEVRRMKMEKRISDAEEKTALLDGKKKVSFEITNMFRTVGKSISGNVVSFCPFFSDHLVFMPLDRQYVTYEFVSGILAQIKSLDYSLFYRDSVYSNTDIGVPREIVGIEVMPDIIFMPGCGSRGTMWQEISGKKRVSPARFVLPIFLNEDLPRTVIRMCGEYRWEMCRRVQGSRWNDISDPSLTSDYCDYIATYKKNKDLNTQAREKIKSSLTKCRNSSKEMFARDYTSYIYYEANGSLRLNKVARMILFRYCPFSKSIRTSLGGNGLYRELIERFNVKNQHAKQQFALVEQRVARNGKQLTSELMSKKKFLNM